MLSYIITERVLFLIWTYFYNPNFSYIEFEAIEKTAGLGSFVFTPNATAQEWRSANPDKKGNIRDYATITELICLANMEAINSEYINEQIPQAERLMKLNRIAISQMQILSEVSGRKLLADTTESEK